MKPIFILLLCTLLWTCEREKVIDINIEKNQERLVLNSFFTQSDTLLLVNLYKSASISESFSGTYDYYQKKFVPQATLKLYDNDLYLGQFSENQTIYSFQLNNKLQATHCYKIVASAPNFESVYAQTSIPEPVKISLIDTLLDTQNNILHCKMTFNEPISSKNQYSIQISAKGKLNGFEQEFSIRFINTDALLGKELGANIDFNTTDQEKQINELFFTDEFINGKQYSYSFSIPLNQYFISDFENDFTLCFHLISLSKDFYEHQRTLNLYKKSETDAFSEPVNVYSNIQNGYGIFAGSSCFIHELELKKFK